MGHILHANATTTPRIRKEIQESMESAPTLAKRLGINIKTVFKWRKADRIEDGRSGPHIPKSALSSIEQQVLVEFRRTTKLSLDDVFITFKDKIPALTRSNLHRCLKRAGVNVLPKEEDPKVPKKKFKDYPLGFIHMDITEVRTEDKKAYLFVAIDRTSKYVYCEIYENMTQEIACSFLKNLMVHCPFKIKIILTDNGAQFTYALLAEHLRPKEKNHPFDQLCQQNNIDHRLTKFSHPWTNGQVEVTNRLLKQYTTKQYHYVSLSQLKEHLMAFLLYYNHQRKLKALHYQSPFDILIHEFEADPSNFLRNPSHMILELNI